MTTGSNFSKLFAAAIGVAAFASIAAPANAAGDPASIAEKYPSLQSPDAAAPYAAPESHYDRGLAPRADHGAAPDQPYSAYRGYENGASLGQGSGMDDAIGR